GITVAYDEGISAGAVEHIAHQRIAVGLGNDCWLDAKRFGQRVGSLLRALDVSDIDPLDSRILQHTGEAVGALFALSIQQSVRRIGSFFSVTDKNHGGGGLLLLGNRKLTEQ